MNPNKKVNVLFLPDNNSEPNINDLVILPTSQRLCLVDKELCLLFKTINRDFYGHHLYVISDDEIKDGDWFIRLLSETIQQANPNSDYKYYDSKKIIATTNTKIKTFEKELPKLPFSFIKEYIKSYNDRHLITEIFIEYYRRGINSEGNDADLTGGILISKNDYYVPKINSDNTIIINEPKEFWSKEEVEDLLHKMYCDMTSEVSYNRSFYDKWIKKHI